MSAQAARLRYLNDQVSTASPAALIVLLYDRLGLDIELAATAQAEHDLTGAASSLAHAQRVVTELLTSLDPSLWTGGDDLAALYGYLLTGLITARTAGDPVKLRALGVIVADLATAWRSAAAELADTHGASGVEFARVG